MLIYDLIINKCVSIIVVYCACLSCHRRVIRIYVADIRGGNKTNNSSVRLDHLLTSEAPASPTHPA